MERDVKGLVGMAVLLQVRLLASQSELNKRCFFCGGEGPFLGIFPLARPSPVCRFSLSLTHARAHTHIQHGHNNTNNNEGLGRMEH